MNLAGTNCLTTRRMLAAAADFHHVRFFSFLAVLTAVLAAFFRRTVASAVSTLSSYFFSHQTDLLESLPGYSIVGGCCGHARPQRGTGQDDQRPVGDELGTESGSDRVIFARVEWAESWDPVATAPGSDFTYLSKPESQCTMFSANCRLSMPERFMPNFI
jgi:hypothetical protein